jgi:aldehyde dehydrogenase (NAD+)
MIHHGQFYIGGRWLDPAIPAALDVIDPSTEQPFTRIAVGSKGDVDRAVAAAKAAFEPFSRTTADERLALLRRILENYNGLTEELAQAVSREMGAPLPFAREAQVWAGRVHLEATIEALQTYEFSRLRGTSLIVKEPIGVAALITPWNWPLNQIVCKVAPALAAGCTIVLKPSEIAPISGILFAEIVEASRAPPGVFNLVNGAGLDVGQVMAAHPDVDMVSFTGSTRAGIIVARVAANTVKRVAQELGGKSPNIILPFRPGPACALGRHRTCPLLTKQARTPARTAAGKSASGKGEALAIAAEVASGQKVGDPREPGIDLGPVVSQTQFEKIQRLIEAAIQEGAKLVAGGPGRPANLNRGYYVRPTVFGEVKPGMTIDREEVFGPVLAVMGYRDEDEAIRIANDTVYGLAAYVSSEDIGHARAVAARLRAGKVNLNYPAWDVRAPFGGFKQSGNGREYADFGIDDYLELKAVVGYC